MSARTDDIEAIGSRAALAGVEGPTVGSQSATSAIQELIEWLAGDECHELNDEGLAAGLGQRLRAAGLAIDRLTLHFGFSNSQALDRTIAWSHGNTLVSWDGDRDEGAGPRRGYNALLQANETDTPQAVRSDVRSDADRAPVDHKDCRIVEVIALPLRGADGWVNTVAFATCRDSGFSRFDRMVLDRVKPALSNACELLAHRTAELALLETYVGPTTAGRVLAGHVRRGEFEALHAGLLLCDLRGFTALSNRLPGESVLELLNAYFDRVVPAITEAGGEVIKFMGDAVLAFFHTDDAATSCAAALGGALKALEGVGEIDADGVKLCAGIALHYGKVGYGNIGSGRRLDFTVIGRDVNLVSRIQSFCSATGIPLVMSERFAVAIAPSKTVTLGRHDLPGFDEPTELYTISGLHIPNDGTDLRRRVTIPRLEESAR